MDEDGDEDSDWGYLVAHRMGVVVVNTLSREKGGKDRQQIEREKRNRMNEGDKIKLLQYSIDAAAVNVRLGIER